VSFLNRLRGDRPPAEASGALDAGDRLLAWTRTDDGGLIAASVRGLRLADGRLLPWHTIDKAVWTSPVLSVTEAAEVAPGVAEAQPACGLRLAEPRDLPAVVRSRVTRSVAYSAHHGLPGSGGVRVVGRRVAGQDGLDWSVRYDDPADRHNPGAWAAAEQLLAAARASLAVS